MPTDIRPGMRVRVTRGKHAGAEGRVVRPSAGGTWATLDVGEAQPIAAYVSALEPIAETPTLRGDDRGAHASAGGGVMSAVIRLAAAVVRGVCDEDGPEAEAMRELALDARREHDAAIAERDRLRRELEALLDQMREWCSGSHEAARYARSAIYGPTIDRLDAILRGES